jgi:hypothetical protein
MMESPPTTPPRRQVLEAPVKYAEGNEENALNFANTPIRSKRNYSKPPQSLSCQSDVVPNDPPGIEQTLSADSDAASDLSVAHLKGWLDDFGKQNRTHYETNNSINMIQRAPSVDSDCESDVSVARLKGWLGEFGKQNRSHCDKVNNIGKTPNGVTLAKPRPKSATVPASQPVVPKSTIRRHTDPVIASVEAKKGPVKTPVRFRKQYQKEEVQATNDGYASVKKIAAWLADDPTSDRRKTTTVRKGINVINKSRMFEKDLEHVIIEEARITKGSVSNRKELFQATASNEEKEKCETASCVSVSDKKKWLQGAFGKPPGNEEPEDDDDDSIVSMSVIDKKTWLQNAFKNAEVGRDKPTTPARFTDKAKRAASAPGAPTMTPMRNEAAVSLVKERFQQRAASRRSLSGTIDPPEEQALQPKGKVPMPPVRHKWQQRAACTSSLTGSSEPAEAEQVKHVESPKTPVRHPENSTVAKWKARQATKAAASPVRPAASPVKASAASVKGSVVSTDDKAPIEENPRVPVEAATSSWKARQATKASIPVEAATSSGRASGSMKANASSAQAPGIPSDEKVAIEEVVDFKAAREKLLQRSAQNGNPVMVFSKVQRRKQKFERLQQEMRQSSNPMGLLKPTWEQPSADGGPTTAYKKTFVDNIAPRKSFEDLP